MFKRRWTMRFNFNRFHFFNNSILINKFKRKIFQKKFYEVEYKKKIKIRLYRVFLIFIIFLLGELKQYVFSLRIKITISSV